jgi:short-subunit dehydrogenase
MQRMTRALRATLITGASAGIGAELARIVAERGGNLLLTARREARLAALAEELRKAHRVRVETLPADLAAPETPAALAETAKAHGLDIVTLYNNAGFGLRGAFAEQPLARIIEMIEVNVTALTRLTGVFLPPMLERREGGIVNIASVAAFEPGPFMAVYYASKAYVLSFSEALSYELRGSGVTVTAICPGPTESEFGEIAGLAASRLGRSATMSSLEVARLAVDGHRAGKRLVVPGAGNAMVPLAARLLPRGLMLRLIAHLQRR